MILWHCSCSQLKVLEFVVVIVIVVVMFVVVAAVVIAVAFWFLQLDSFKLINS